MSVDKKWDEFSTVTTLPDASFLALLDTTQIIDNQNQILTSLNAKTYFQETLVTTVDAQNNTIDALGTISFLDTDTSLTQSVNDLLYDVAINGTHVFRVDDSIEYSFDVDQADFGENDIVNISNLGVGVSVIGDYTLDVNGNKVRLSIGDTVGEFNDVTFEHDNFGGGNASLFFNRDDSGVNQSEFVMVNISNSTTTDRYFKLFYTDDGFTSGTGFTIRKGGNLGLGTNSPDSLLHLSGIDDQVQFKIQTFPTQTNNVIEILNSSNDELFILGNTGNVTITGTLIDPIITSFTNANHDHSDVIGGGQLDSILALSDTDTITYLNTDNVYSASLTQNFGTSNVTNIGSLSIGTETTPDTFTLFDGSFTQRLDDGDDTGLTTLSTLTLGTNPSSVVVVGNYVYVTDPAANDLKIIDATDKSNPEIISSLPIGTTPAKVFVSGRYAYVIDSGSNDLKIIDITDKTNPVTIANVNVGGTPTDLFVIGRYAYVVDDADNNLKIVDISDPSNPTVVVAYDVGTNPTNIFVVGRYVYIVDQDDNNLEIVDISDIDNISTTGNLTMGGGPNDIYVVGRYAFITDFAADSLYSIDISDPSNPTIIDSVGVGVTPRSVVVSGKYAYILEAGGNTLDVFDISDPTSMVKIGEQTLGSQVFDVDVSGKYAYTVQSGEETLRITDVSGIDVQTANIGSLLAGNIQITDNCYVDNNFTASGINVGINGIYSDGDIATSGKLGINGIDISQTDSTPESLLTGSIGDIAIDSTNGHQYLKKTGDTTNTGWMQVSMNTTEIVQINTSDDFTAQATSDIIAVAASEDLTNRFQITPITATEFTVTGINSNLRLIDDGIDNFIVYTNTGTFITGDNGGACNVENIGLAAFSAGTLLSFTATNRDNDVGSLFFSRCTMSGWNMGTISRYSTSEFGPLIDIDSSVITNWASGLTVDTVFLNVNKCLIDQSLGFTSSTSVFNVTNTAHKKAQASFRDLFGTLYSGETLVRINAGIPNDQKVVLTGNVLDLDASDGLFDTSGATGTFTAVADNSISSTGITGVTDSNGVASFTHAGTSPELGSTVTISGFTTNTDYNTTGIVTATNTTTFEVDYIIFGTDETGSYESIGVTITSISHGLSPGEGVTLDTTLATDYDAGYLIYNIQTDSFDVAATFTSTLSGTWSTEGLDQTDPRVVALANPGTQDSKVLAFGFTNGNVDIETIITDGVYTAINVLGFSEEDITQRFKLINTTDGIFELTSLEDFEGFLSGSLTVGKDSSSAQNYRFSLSTNSVAPVFATANYIPLQISSVTINVKLEFFVSLTKGDTVQIMVAGNGATETLKITDITLSIQ